MSDKKEYPIIAFENPKAFQQWLAEHHADENGIWLQLYKKDSEVATISHAQALDEALCYGWIDGQAKKYDEKSWLIKFTPRRSRSMWSKRNREYVERLINAGKNAGRWI